MTRDEEVKQRIELWEKQHNRQLETLSRDEWIEAAQEILALTRPEAEEYLDYLIQQKSGMM